MVHRYLATGVGVLIVTLAAATWLQRKRGVPVQPRWPVFTLAWVCLQGAFGALTVTMKLFPAIVTLHLLGGMVLLALLAVQAVAYRQAQRGSGALWIPASARAWLLVAYVLLWLQIALGGWVSTNYAVLACSSFPTCQGSWWPAMEFSQGFEVWRALGMTGGGEHVTFAALTAIHYTHRLVAYVLFVVLGVTAWRLRAGSLRSASRAIAGLALWQFASGLSNVVLGWPLVAAVAHTGGAAALVVALTWALRESRAASTAAAPRVNASEVSA
jgi:cytochrome c oxidase assembly protein subunit 15